MLAILNRISQRIVEQASKQRVDWPTQNAGFLIPKPDVAFDRLVQDVKH